MATAVSQHFPHLGHNLGFLKNFIFSKTLQPIFLKLVENMFLLPQIGISLRIKRRN